MYKFESSTQFKKDFKALIPADETRVIKALEILAEKGTLPFEPYFTHPLKGKYKGCLEAHIRPDLLLIWFERVHDTIKLIRVGSHAKLFKK